MIPRPCTVVLLMGLIACARGQLPLLVAPSQETPPPNPFGETNPPLNTDLAPRPTPPPLILPANPPQGLPANPNPAPVQGVAPPLFNPPTPPPLPTPPPIGAISAPSSSDKGNVPQGAKRSTANNPFDKLSSDTQPNVQSRRVPVPQKGSAQWTGSSSNDDVHMTAAGWPRVPRESGLWSLLRRKRQSLGDSIAAAKPASQLTNGAGSIPGTGGMPGTGGVPGASSVPGTSGIPDASSVPGASSIPGAGGLPGTDSVPGAGSSPSGGGQPSISTFPDNSGDIVMPPDPSPKPTTPRFMLPRHLDAIKASPEALQALNQFG